MRAAHNWQILKKQASFTGESSNMKFSSSHPISYQCYQRLEQNKFNSHIFFQIFKPKKVGPSKTCCCHPYKLFTVSFVVAQYNRQFGSNQVDFWFARVQRHLLGSSITKKYSFFIHFSSIFYTFSDEQKLMNYVQIFAEK